MGSFFLVHTMTESELIYVPFRQARRQIRDSDRSMLAEPRQLWAVAVPVTVRLDGDAHPGLPICGHQFTVGEGEATAVNKLSRWMLVVRGGLFGGLD
jgi:hypothetical protein